MKEKPKLHIASCSFGKDSIATILLALENNEPLDRVVFAEVMFDHERGISGEIPEHIEWIYNTAIPKLAEMGVKVDVVREKRDLCAHARHVYATGKRSGQKKGLPSGKFCYANGELKVKPMNAYYKDVAKDYDVVKYIGIAIDEPKRLERLKGTNKVSLLAKYGYTEEMAMEKCKEYGLASPLYSMGYRGGCWFCYNANLERYIHIRKMYPEYWQALRDLYYESNSKCFKYGKTLADIEKEMDAKEQKESNQLKILL